MVGDVLTQCETSVGVGAGEDFDAVELGYEFVGESIERVGIALCPPVVEVAVFVELTTLVV